ncbi:aldo-keto reductase family 1 member C1-like [Corticium candelabrum]|uniref:aldo-keto reductase family 1 member C1-like n=1 Tax=Corticium candelabrum TaxID=121492 RepID=UPI002E33B2B8|nr:aldo-keto reductase family 1 member C1-like [Corticium candelabrum]
MAAICLNTGKKIPALAFGTWNASGMPRSSSSDDEIIFQVIAANGRHIDTASIYGNEEDVGKAVQRALSSGLVKRDDLFVCTKLWCAYHSRVGVASEVRLSLEKLQLDYVDLYLIHAPWSIKPDSALKPKSFMETWRAMEELYDSGVARAIGVCNFTVKKLDELLEYARITPVINQVESHPYLQQNELLEYCRSKGIVFSAFSPLGSPKRGPNNRRDDDPILLDDPVVCDIAQQHNVYPAQVLLQWGLQRGAAVVTKASTKERVGQALDACTLQLSLEDVSRLDGLECGFRYLRMEPFKRPGQTLADIWDQ